MKRGQIFDLHQEGKTIRAMALEDNKCLDLNTLKVIDGIIHENEIEEIIIEDILTYPFSNLRKYELS